MFRSLTSKILGSMILLTSICTLSFTLLSYFQLQQSVTNQMKNDGSALITSINREVNRFRLSDLDQMYSILQQVKKESSGNLVYVSITDNNSKIIVSDSNKPETAQNNATGSVDAVSSATTMNETVKIDGGTQTKGSFFNTPSGEKVYNLSMPFYYDSKQFGTLNIGISLRGMYTEIWNSMLKILAIALFIQLLTIFIGILISRGVTKPIKGIVEKLGDFSKGDFTVEFENKGRDEIRKLTDSLNSSVVLLKQTIESVKSVSTQLYDISTCLSESGGEVAANSETVSNKINEVSVSVTKQSDSIIHIEQIFNSFNKTLDKIFSDMQEVLVHNEKIKGSAAEGRKSLGSLINSTEDIRSSFNSNAEKISSLNGDVTKVNAITEVINSVAVQTNLLALNAAIEAARAGDAGKGFSVVAEEIRKLSNQVMESSNSINELIQTITAGVREVADTTVILHGKMDDQITITDETVNSFKNIQDEMHETVLQVQNVSGALKGILVEKDKILGKVVDMSASSQQVSAVADEIFTCVEEQSEKVLSFAKTAKDLHDMAERLKKDVGQFKS